MIHRNPTIIALIAVLFILTGQARASELGQNAALRYWLAMAVMPDYNETQAKELAEWRTTPLNEDVEAIVTGAEASLGMLHRGASILSCDWGLDILEDGPNTLMPHLGKARQLARLACLCARWRFVNGDADGAIDDLTATIALARHLASGRILIGQLVGYSIENMAINCIADHFDRCNTDALKGLKDKLSALPPAPAFIDAIEGERDCFVGWAKHQVRTGHIDRLTALLTNPDPDAPAAQPSVKDLTKDLDDLDDHYTQLIEFCKLPLDEFDTRDKAFADKVKQSDNVWVRTMLPAISSARHTAVAAEVRLAMLRAAIAYRLGGQAGFEVIEQPYGTGPFKLSKGEKGFTLESVVNHRGTQLTLTFRADWEKA
ncbi:MAG: hypothetical protein GC164_12820 [Phycisphaera sp.]|nr:hypothetical protein [Phycisphaera sp.]